MGVTYRLVNQCSPVPGPFGQPPAIPLLGAANFSRAPGSPEDRPAVLWSPAIISGQQGVTPWQPRLLISESDYRRGKVPFDVPCSRPPGVLPFPPPGPSPLPATPWQPTLILSPGMGYDPIP